MGYCIDELELPLGLREWDFERPPHPEFPDEIVPDIVGAEMRSESFVLVSDGEHERIELLYDQIPRLRAILDFIEEKRTKKAPGNRRL